MGGSLGTTGDYYYGVKLAMIVSLISVPLTLFIPNSSISSLMIKQKIMKILQKLNYQRVLES